ncbi:class II aldolase/adducin family protein [Kribbella sp. NPDC051718]|uniref:class II aldolase/adducin family protein n=1 Tax=Kribbella sp. NPDC051718 TaxID=3155168 RepID=UPI00342F7D4F
MMYERERRLLVETVRELESTDVLEVGGGAVGLRVSDDHALVTPTGIPYRRWEIPAGELLVADIRDGSIVEMGTRLGAAPTPMFLALLSAFPEIGAIIHGHPAWSLVYAAAGREVPAVTNAFDKISPVPLIHCDDATLKRQYLETPWPVFYPESMLRRPDVAAVEAFMVEKASAYFGPRRAELAVHSLAFTMYRHGIVVAGNSLERAAADLAIIEANARTAWHVEAIQGRLDGQPLGDQAGSAPVGVGA